MERMKSVLHLVLGFFYCFALSQSLSVPEQSIQFLPSRIEFHQVSQQYPVTLARRLFSSVPRREYALFNINFNISNDFVLLTGESASGKTTILRLLAGQETPTSGQIRINASEDVPEEKTRQCCNPQAVYLDTKPSLHAQSTVESILQKACRPLSCPFRWAATQQLCRIVNMDQCLNTKAMDLSSSELLLLDILVACIHSSLSNYRETTEGQFLVPAPILLLDEWLDKETSTIVRNVQEKLGQLTAQAGATVIVVTHYPQRFKSTNCVRFQMSRGKMAPIVHASTSAN